MSSIMKSYDDLNDYIRSLDDNFPEEYDYLAKKIDELICEGFIETALYNDNVLYSAKKSLRMEEYKKINPTLSYKK